MIVVDTHAFLFWLSEPRRLSRPAARALARADRIGVPDIVLWELAMLFERGRITLATGDVEAWLDDAVAQPRVELLPVTPAIAVRSTRLSARFHGDPADRLIAATAIVEGAPLVSADEKLRAFAAIDVIW